jgi:hypothetical protein
MRGFLCLQPHTVRKSKSDAQEMASFIRLRLQINTCQAHTPTMTVKNAALLAFIGTVLITALLVWRFVFTFLNVLRDLVPAVALFSSFIFAFGCFCVMVFFFVFYRAQS